MKDEAESTQVHVFEMSQSPPSAARVSVRVDRERFTGAEHRALLERGIGFGAHQPPPQDAVELRGRSSKRAGQWGIDWEAQAGASATVCVGPLLFNALVGPSFLQRTFQSPDELTSQHELRTGVLAMAGAGGRF